MDPYHYQTHFGTPQWQPPSANSMFSVQRLPSSTASLCTPQWGPNGYNQPPSTTQWDLNSPNMPSSTPQRDLNSPKPSSTPQWDLNSPKPPSTTQWDLNSPKPSSTTQWDLNSPKPSSTPQWDPTSDYQPPYWGPTSDYQPPYWGPTSDYQPPYWGPTIHYQPPYWSPLSYNQPSYWSPTSYNHPSYWSPTSYNQQSYWSPTSYNQQSYWSPTSYNQPPYWGPTSHNQPPSEVVLTPVHSIGSERNVNDSATKIQRVARGFLVRKSVKKMLKIKVELEEIKRKVIDEGTVKIIKKVQMERKKFDENLTSLLLRLDSIRVFDCHALRGFRRSLVDRAVFLQEFVDQVKLLNVENEDGNDGTCVREATKIQKVARGYLVRKTMKKMLKIKVELEEIKKKVNDEETVKMIKEVQMERLKIDENLTSLLLRLDSVRVFGCSELRGFRRSLVKRACFLQEFVDQIVNEENEDVRAATKIQMIARGYLVRESMKKMLKIKAELEEIEKKVNNEETVKIMKKEQEERIRMNGAIMDLLLRLDSARVFRCSALRGFRRSLVKRAIFLQEFVDQIQMVSEETEDGEDGKSVRAATKIQMVARGYLVRKNMKKMLKMKVELEKIEKKVNNEETVKIMKKEQEERIRMVGAIMDLLLRLDSVKVFPWSPLKDLKKSLINRAIFLDEFMDQIQTVAPAHEVEDDVEVKSDDVKEDEDEEMMEVLSSVESCLVEEEDGGIDSEMLTRMMDENREMLRRIMDDSEKQTSVLASLTQRVEQLERAFT